jgi:hypothetical protein
LIYWFNHLINVNESFYDYVFNVEEWKLLIECNLDIEIHEWNENVNLMI